MPKIEEIVTTDGNLTLHPTSVSKPLSSKDIIKNLEKIDAEFSGKEETDREKKQIIPVLTKYMNMLDSYTSYLQGFDIKGIKETNTSILRDQMSSLISNIKSFCIIHEDNESSISKDTKSKLITQIQSFASNLNLMHKSVEEVCREKDLHPSSPDAFKIIHDSSVKVINTLFVSLLDKEISKDEYKLRRVSSADLYNSKLAGKANQSTYLNSKNEKLNTKNEKDMMSPRSPEVKGLGNVDCGYEDLVTDPSKDQLLSPLDNNTNKNNKNPEVKNTEGTSTNNIDNKTTPRRKSSIALLTEGKDNQIISDQAALVSITTEKYSSVKKFFLFLASPLIFVANKIHQFYLYLKSRIFKDENASMGGGATSSPNKEDSAVNFLKFVDINAVKK